MSEEVQKGVKLWITKQIIFLFFFLVPALFIPAGTLRWPLGWLHLGLYVISMAAQFILLIPRQPGLLAERSKAQKGTKKWDMFIASSAAAWLPLATWIVAGLDFRHEWSAPLPLWVILLSVVVWLAGYSFTIWAMASNAFFSATVRIQDDRGHSVQSGGPYRFVRHPGYVGAIIFQLVTPLLLNSWWAFIPSSLAALLYIIRTGLEDKTLRVELPGYEEFTHQTEYRLIPGIW